MRLPSIFAPLRRHLGWALALTLLGGALCFVPLFDLLAFEFSFAVGLFAAPLGLHLGALYARRHRTNRRALAAAAGHVLVLLAAPLLIISLNALRRPNCNYTEGLLFYALLPLTNATVGLFWGAAGQRLWPRARWRPRLFNMVIFFSALALSLWRFYAEPPVDLYNTFLGYWPGALYDEVVPLGTTLMLARLEDLSYGALALFAATFARRHWIWPATAALCALFVASAAQRVGLRRDARMIQESLGGVWHSAHFDLYYPHDWPAEEVHALALNLEFEYTELRAFFGRGPEKIEAWLYPDVAHKKRLMGAGTTRISKPWQRAIHVHAPRVGQAVLRHELAHAFSADLVGGPLHLPLWRGFLPHMPLIEGLAEAATGSTGLLSLNEWAAVIRQQQIGPQNLRALLSPVGFYTHNAALAYTQCGAFFTDYAQHSGRDALLDAYARAGLSDTELDAAVTAWQARLDTRVLDERLSHYARARFDRPSIFGKTCAHEVAALRAERDAALGAGQYAQAEAINETILGHVPLDVQGRLVRLALWMQRGADEAAIRWAQELSEDRRIGAQARDAVKERLADLWVRQGQAERARVLYADALAQAFAPDRRRRLALKLYILEGAQVEAQSPEGGVQVEAQRPEGGVQVEAQHPEGGAQVEAQIGEAARSAAWALLLSPYSTVEERAGWVEVLMKNAPSWSVSLWLSARHHAAQGAYAEAAQALDALAQAAPLPPSFTQEALRMQAELAFAQGQYVQAARLFGVLAEAPTPAGEPDSESLREAAARWARRARFFEAQRAMR